MVSLAADEEDEEEKSAEEGDDACQQATVEKDLFLLLMKTPVFVAGVGSSGVEVGVLRALHK